MKNSETKPIMADAVAKRPTQVFTNRRKCLQQEIKFVPKRANESSRW